jgi:hypothetical protein
MTIVVENGTGLSNATAYVSVVNADAYHTAMGNTAWTGTEAAKEIAIRRATQYLDFTFRWRGVRLTTTQALENPRTPEDLEFMRDDTVWPPRGLEEACAEVAMRALTGELISDLDEDQYITREKVGPIETVFSSPVNGRQPIFPIAVKLLRGLIRNSGSSRTIVRSS